MSDRPTFRNSTGAPFAVHHVGGQHTVSVGKISQGKKFNTNPFLDAPLVLGQTRVGKTRLQVEVIAGAIIQENTHSKSPFPKKRNR